jgi:hypothetical protein
MNESLRQVLVGAAGIAFGAIISGIAIALRFGVKSAIRFAIIEEKQKYFTGQMRQVLRRMKMADEDEGKTED